MIGRQDSVASFVAGLLLATLAGCASENPEAPVATLPVKGKVTFKGQPLDGGTVVFEPEGAGREGQAEIRPDGTFELSTYKAGDGAVPGAHRVSVRDGLVRKSRIPRKYANAASSKIEMEVAKDKSDYLIELN